MSATPDTLAAATATGAEPRRILLIEDNGDAREMLRLLLETEGHVVYDAADGDRGLALLDAASPDIAFIDIGLPGLSGYEVAQRIRAHRKGRAMMLVALTGYGRANDAHASTDAGFDLHLVKPINPDDLTRILRAPARQKDEAS